MDPITFITALDWDDLPLDVRQQVKRSLLDLIGVGIAGRKTALSGIIHAYATTEHAGQIRLPFDSASASASGVALAYGMTIDSIDAHDGFNPAKGHIGCPLWPAVYALGAQATGMELLTTLALGYEFGARCSIAQHSSVPDYHTSGSWGAVAAAAAGARLAGLDAVQTRHALGIAEYHGPRSQMMRVIDHPTMLKDGAGWGAMCGVSAVRLAASGFTGAPAIIVENARSVWSDLGGRWYLREQYYKPYPVCRWAQAPVEAVLALRSAHGLDADDVDHIEIATFHEAIRLATARPETTEEAQYSTSFPVAVAMVRGDVTAEDVMPAALSDPHVLRLSEGIVMSEDAGANADFPLHRKAKVTLHLRNGQRVSSDWTEPKWEHTAPPETTALQAKFISYATPVIGDDRAASIVDAVERLETLPAGALHRLMAVPP